MPAETSGHKLPYPVEGDSADVPRDVKALAERIDTLLTKGGDVSVAADGTITIGAKKVVTGMIADALKPSAGAAAGTEALRALGTSASTAAAGNDSRLSDERTPKATSVTTGKIADHAVTPIKLAEQTSSAIAAEALPLPESACVVVTSVGTVKKIAPGFPGQVVKLFANPGVVIFKPGEGGGEGGLKMAGEFAAGQGDSITFAYISFFKSWVEVARSNNV